MIMADAFSSAINYLPLLKAREIRLVTLARGSVEDLIRCSVFHAELGNQRYEALSHEWGFPTTDDPTISVNLEDNKKEEPLRCTSAYQAP
jgi:hypothetical protein